MLAFDRPSTGAQARAGISDEAYEACATFVGPTSRLTITEDCSLDEFGSTGAHRGDDPVSHAGRSMARYRTTHRTRSRRDV